MVQAFWTAADTGSSASSQAMSSRGTMMEVSCRSSSRNTLRTIWCSCSSMMPASTPSSRLALISSSVTCCWALVLMRSSLSTHCVVCVSSHTKGLAALATKVMGRDTPRATASGYSCPMRLGTSSPNTMVTKVMTATTMAVALISAVPGVRPQPCKANDRSPLKAASPTMPLSMPMEVMPTCTDERNCVGCSSSFSAA